MADAFDDSEFLVPADEEELYLEKIVFGDADGFAENLKNIDNLYVTGDDADTAMKLDAFHFSDSEPDEYLDTLSKHGRPEFSDVSDDESNNGEDDDEDDIGKMNDDELFLIDSEAEDVEMDLNNDQENASVEEESSDEDAWEDSDDEYLEISLTAKNKLLKLRSAEDEDKIDGNIYITRLRNQFERIYPTPKWAESPKFEEELSSDEDEENGNKLTDSVGNAQSTTITASSNPLSNFLQQNQTYNLTEKSKRVLNSGDINIDRLTDANIKKPSLAVIQSMHFHPTQPILLTGGFDKSLRLYHIDGKHNNLITSLYLRNSPVKTCAFHIDPTNGTTNILTGGRRRYMYKWNVDRSVIEKISHMYGQQNQQRSFEYFKISNDQKYLALSGGSGWVNLLNIQTGQLVHGFKVEGQLQDFEFSPDNLLIVVNRAGEVWEFNLNSFDIERRWNDVTSLGITKLRVSPNGRFLAIGSNTGFVNVYDRMKNNILIKSIENLITRISCIEFSHDSQVMCIASNGKKDALKLVHLPSCKVFRNWPTPLTPLGKISNVAFAPSGGLLATGNEQGRVRLWRLNDLA